jgi:uncharacterized membrane protein HdeD (DUF308 family)
MIVFLARNWWALAWRGMIAVLFGVAAFAWPGSTLTVLAMFFGAFALLDGALALATTMVGRPRGSYARALIAEGVVGIAVGILALLWPMPMITALIYLIAAWAMITGVLEIFMALQLRREVDGEWLLAMAGILSMFLGLVLALWPRAAAYALLWLIGAYAVLFGAALLALALRLRTWGRRFPSVGV